MQIKDLLIDITDDPCQFSLDSTFKNPFLFYCTLTKICFSWFFLQRFLQWNCIGLYHYGLSLPYVNIYIPL
jgi:hypothetical protein